MKEHINITVNGMKHLVDCEKSSSLLEILRDHLGLMGAKEGCGYGECGACTVIMNGKAVAACTVRNTAKINDSEIITIEGLADEAGNLHPLQAAFVEAGAIQCGFCTPGFIMRLYALFDVNPAASHQEIREVLAKNLCRCTGYEAIWEAIMNYQQKLLRPSAHVE